MGENSPINSRERQNALTPPPPNDLNFRLARDKVAHLKTAAMFVQAGFKQMMFL